ncbi:hypothetical protein ACFPRL_07935 [Pseudoclavibacter helvolus]
MQRRQRRGHWLLLFGLTLRRPVDRDVAGQTLLGCDLQDLADDLRDLLLRRVTREELKRPTADDGDDLRLLAELRMCIQVDAHEHDPTFRAADDLGEDGRERLRIA